LINKIYIFNQQKLWISEDEMKFEWEYIKCGAFPDTYRAKVIGGWIVRSSYCDGDGNTISMVFIPDHNHI